MRANKRIRPADPPPFDERSHLHRRIFGSSSARGAITPGITTRKTFHPPPADPQSAAARLYWREKERMKEVLERGEGGRGERRGARTTGEKG